MIKIPILMYHHTYGNGKGVELKSTERSYAVSADCLKSQLDSLASHNFKTVLPQDVFGCSQNRVMLTFDDGYRDNFTEAFPLLASQGLRAIFFVTAGMLGAKGYMDAKQLAQMAAAGMVIGSHGMTHRFFSDLTDDVLMSEFVESRKILEDAIGEPVTMLSLPGGRMHPRLMRHAPRAGYEHIFTSFPSCYIVNVSNQEKNQIECRKYPRIPIRNTHSNLDFERIITADPLFYLRLRFVFALKEAGKIVLGNSRYLKLHKQQSWRKKI